MAADLLAQLDAYLSALTAAGVRATSDARDVNPPAVLIRPPVMTFRFGRGCIQADWVARVVLPNSGTRQAMETGVPLIEQIQTALGGVIVTATPADFELPDGGGPTPGYQLAWSTHQ